MADLYRIETRQGEVEVELYRLKRARCMRLKVDRFTGRVSCTIPPFAHQRDVEAFLNREAGWIDLQLEQVNQRQPLGPGSAFPYRGEDWRLETDPQLMLIRESEEDKTLSLPARFEARLEAVLVDWLKHKARSDMEKRAREKARVLGKPLRRVFIRDNRSNWGTCSNVGNLGFSWRLIMAPDLVRDYMAAHEVAHLKHPHHRLEFWQETARLMEKPQRLGEAKRLLKTWAPKLFSLG